MGAISTKLRTVAGNGARGLIHWCPGCDGPHVIWTKRANEGESCWAWNGHIENPTCTPSVRVFTTTDEDGEPIANGGQRTLCHYNMTDGMLVFHGDSPHALGGQTVPIPDWPYAPGAFGGIE